MAQEATGLGDLSTYAPKKSALPQIWRSTTKLQSSTNAHLDQTHSTISSNSQSIMITATISQSAIT